MEGAMEVVSDIRYDLAMARDPNQVLAEAMNAAKALQSIIKQKAKPVVFGGKKYVEFEDWQVLGRFYGVTARIVSTEYIDIGGTKGFLARAEAVDSTGRVISAAEAMCLNDEDKWSTRTKYEYINGVKTKTGDVAVPLFQLRSMSQTRACAKSLRNVLAWVVVMAGYEPSVAEEMTGDENSDSPKREPIAPPKAKAAVTHTFGANADDQNIGIVEAVIPKDGGTPEKPWRKYGVKIGGEFYGTFDEKMGPLAESLVGKKAKYAWKPNAKKPEYKDLTAIEAA